MIKPNEPQVPTVEVIARDAVAKMVNMDYIPDGFTLEEMLSAFTEEAEVDYENAQAENLPEEELQPLRARVEICKAREKLALMLQKDLHAELSNPSIESDIPKAIEDWAAFKYGIGIQMRPTSQSDISWEDIEIRIRKGHTLAYSCKGGDWKTKQFDEIGLLNKKTKKPNYHALILFGFSSGKKFPPGNKIEKKHSVAIHRLRSSLWELTGITCEPFKEPNETDGWKPRFKLSDRRKDADERAKKAAQHEQYNDEHSYESYYDETDKWIDKNR